MPYVCIAAIIQSERIAQNPLQCLLFSGGKAMIKDGQFYIDFPEPYKRRELNSKYREIPLKDTTSRQLRKYFNAMANLYGSFHFGKHTRSYLLKAPSWLRGTSSLPLRKSPGTSARTTISWVLTNSMWMGNSKMSWTERS